MVDGAGLWMVPDFVEDVELRELGELSSSGY